MRDEDVYNIANYMRIINVFLYDTNFDLEIVTVSVSVCVIYSIQSILKWPLLKKNEND